MNKFKIGDKVKLKTHKKLIEIKPNCIGVINSSYPENGRYFTTFDDMFFTFHEDDLILVIELPCNEEIEKMEVTASRFTVHLDKQEKEFDATRLGYYKMRDGDKSYVSYILDKPIYKYNEVCGFFILNDGTQNPSYWWKNGKNNINSKYDLIEYLGPELPKEPRKFEFEAKLLEREGNVDERNPLHLLFNKTVFILNGDFEYSPGYEGIFSKWKVVMQEIIE